MNRISSAVAALAGVVVVLFFVLHRYTVDPDAVE